MNISRNKLCSARNENPLRPVGRAGHARGTGKRRAVAVVKSALASLSLGLFALPVWAAEFEFLLQSSDGKSENNFRIQREWLDAVEQRSNNRLAFELLPKQGVVSYNETWDAIKLGLLDGHLSASEYFTKIDPAVALLGNTVGAWSDTAQLLQFMYEGGGNEIMREIYAKHGVHFVGAYTSGVEAFVSKVPLDGVDDLKGVKVRTPGGLISSVFAAAGAEPVELPGSQVTQALRNGFIEAADYTVFSTNQAQGMNDIAPHPVQPGFHSLPLLEFSINAKRWSELPTDLQSLLEREIRNFAKTYTDTFRQADIEAIAVARDDSNITIHDWSTDERRKFRAIAQKEWAKIAEQSPSAQNAFDTLTRYLKQNNLL